MSHQCLPDGQRHRARLVYRGLHQDEVEAVRRWQDTVAFRKRLNERRWKIEGIFDEAKQNHGLRRARYRGLAELQIQLYFIAIALNCKRMILRFYHFLLQLLNKRWPRSIPNFSLATRGHSGSAMVTA